MQHIFHWFAAGFRQQTEIRKFILNVFNMDFGLSNQSVEWFRMRCCGKCRLVRCGKLQTYWAVCKKASSITTNKHLRCCHAMCWCACKCLPIAQWASSYARYASISAGFWHPVTVIVELLNQQFTHQLPLRCETFTPTLISLSLFRFSVRRTDR